MTERFGRTDEVESDALLCAALRGGEGAPELTEARQREIKARFRTRTNKRLRREAEESSGGMPELKHLGVWS